MVVGKVADFRLFAHGTFSIQCIKRTLLQDGRELAIGALFEPKEFIRMGELLKKRL